MPDRELTISTANRHDVSKWEPEITTWQSFAEHLNSSREIPSTPEEFAKLPDAEQRNLKNGPCYVLGALDRTGMRQKGHLLTREGLTYDLDSIDRETLNSVLRCLTESGYNYVCHSSASYDGQNAKVRVIIPFSRSIEPAEYRTKAKAAASIFGIPLTDDACSFEDTHLFYFPTHLKSVHPIYEACVDGELLDPDILVATDIDSESAQAPNGAPPYEREITPYQRITNGEMIKQGERDITLFRYASALRAMDVPEEEALEQCFKVNSQQFDPPLSEKEVREKVKSAYKFPSGLEQDFMGLVPENAEKIKFVDVKTTQGGGIRILPTAANVKAILDYFQIEVYFDVILRKIVCSSNNKNLPPALRDNLGDINILGVFLSDLAIKKSIPNLTSGKAVELLTLIAKNDSRNIPLDKLKEAHSTYQDQEANLKEFNLMLDCITFSQEETLERTFIEKWLCQVCAMLSNDLGLYGAEACLTLVGGQGIGKTRFGKYLCSFFGLDYYREGFMFSKTKDDQINFTNCAIGEIGEAARSLRDVDYMKNFLTETKDEFRPPYGRNMVSYPRRSTYYATVNNEKFLRDDENRRFWVVQISWVDQKALKRINLGMVWAYAYSEWLSKGQESFRMSAEEREQAARLAEAVREESAEEQALNDSLDWDAPIEDWSFKTSTDIARDIGLPTQSNRYVGRAMRNLGYKKGAWPKEKRIKGGVNFYNVPPVWIQYPGGPGKGDNV